MRAVSGNITVPASSRILVFSIPISELHNITVKAAGSLYLGGEEIETSKGLGMETGDVVSWNWQDFRTNETGNLSIYATATVQTSLTYLIWRR